MFHAPCFMLFVPGLGFHPSLLYCLYMIDVSYLDTPGAAAIDADNLAAILRQFPDQLATASKEFAKLKLPREFSKVKQVVFCGMGGSAIGAEVACDLPIELIRKPLFVLREYELPKFVGPDTLVVIVSHSGDTEEPLACFKQALKAGCPIVAIAGGGALAKQAKAQAVPLYHFNYVTQPRDAFGYLFAPLVKLLEASGVLQPSETSLEPAIAVCRELTAQFDTGVPTAKNMAKHLAYLTYDHIPLVVGSGVLCGVARRWKNQFNEHSKSAAFFDLLPETDHNTVEGFDAPARFHDDVMVFLLTSSYDYPEITKRAEILHQFLAKNHILTEVVQPLKAGDLWVEKLSQLLLGDWVSYYLALLYRTNPTPVPVIDELKSALRKG